jgi:hypothetical protein
MKKNQKMYIDKIAEMLVEDTHIDFELGYFIYPFLTTLKIPIGFDGFNNSGYNFLIYCRDLYGISGGEIIYLWNQYIYLLENKLKNGRK